LGNPYNFLGRREDTRGRSSMDAGRSVSKNREKLFVSCRVDSLGEKRYKQESRGNTPKQQNKHNKKKKKKHKNKNVNQGRAKGDDCGGVRAFKLGRKKPAGAWEERGADFLGK